MILDVNFRRHVRRTQKATKGNSVIYTFVVPLNSPNPPGLSVPFQTNPREDSCLNRRKFLFPHGRMLNSVAIVLFLPPPVCIGPTGPRLGGEVRQLEVRPLFICLLIRSTFLATKSFVHNPCHFFGQLLPTGLGQAFDNPSHPFQWRSALQYGFDQISEQKGRDMGNQEDIGI